MRTIVLLPGLPAALAYCRPQIGRDGARRHAQSNQKIAPAAVIPVEHGDYHRMMVPTRSYVIRPVQAQHGYHRATPAAAKSP
jgi:hypothetical protein